MGGMGGMGGDSDDDEDEEEKDGEPQKDDLDVDLEENLEKKE